MDWNLEHAIVDYQDDLREACWGLVLRMWKRILW